MFNRKVQRQKRHLRLRQRVIGTAARPRMSICVTNRLETVPAKYQLLGDAIPAESYATGRNPVPSWGEEASGNSNQDMIMMRDVGISRAWNHGYLKDMSYRYIHRLFEDVLTRMEE